MGNKLTPAQQDALYDLGNANVGEKTGIGLEVAEDLGYGSSLAALEQSVGSSAVLSTNIAPERGRNTKGKHHKKLSMTLSAVRARERRARQRREIDERIALNRGPFDTDLGGR